MNKIFVVSLTIGVLAICYSIYLLSPNNSLIKNAVSKLKAVFFYSAKHKRHSVQLFTKEELARHRGGDGKKLYLAIIGRVYDVTKGSKHYGPSGAYHFFTGIDGSKAFVTGEFNEKGLTDDLTGLEESDYTDLKQWIDLYEKDYTFLGHLCGTFYDCVTGKATEALKSYRAKLKRAQKSARAHNDELKIYPSCNSQWSGKNGGEVWCSDQSGGDKRTWVGVPRQYHMKTTRSTRCVCVRNKGPPSNNPQSTNHNDRGDLDDPRLKEYDDCAPDAVSCKLPS